MIASVERPQPLPAPYVPQAAPLVVDPGMLHVEVDADAPFMAGRLNATDTAKAREILAYLRARGVLVTAGQEEILLVIARPIAPALLARTEANAALLRAALACPQCQRRHSLCPPYGRCWPCGEEAQQAARGPCAFLSRVAEAGEEASYAL